MRVGEYEVNAVETGHFRLDGGAMFGVVPKVLWEKTNPADEKNRIEMALRSMLIRGRGRVILVDCGIGAKWGPRQVEMFGIDHSRARLDHSLKRLGVSPNEVTDVVISHLHFDHVGGATGESAMGEVRLTFPNATHYIQEGNLAHAHAPTERDRASFIESTIQPLEKSDRLKLMRGGYDLIPGVTIRVTHGHTVGQQLVQVHGNGRTILFCADTIPTSSHVPVPYVMSYDLDPVTTMEEKKGILRDAYQGGWILFWVHDPFKAASMVATDGAKYRAAETVSL